MSYADEDRQRRAKREWARKHRACLRVEAGRPEPLRGHASPAAPWRRPQLSADIAEAGVAVSFKKENCRALP